MDHIFESGHITVHGVWYVGVDHGLKGDVGLSIASVYDDNGDVIFSSEHPSGSVAVRNCIHYIEEISDRFNINLN